MLTIALVSGFDYYPMIDSLMIFDPSSKMVLRKTFSEDPGFRKALTQRRCVSPKRWG
jgi:hypothetical protein